MEEIEDDVPLTYASLFGAEADEADAPELLLEEEEEARPCSRIALGC